MHGLMAALNRDWSCHQNKGEAKGEKIEKKKCINGTDVDGGWLDPEDSSIDASSIFPLPIHAKENKKVVRKKALLYRLSLLADTKAHVYASLINHAWVICLAWEKYVARGSSLWKTEKTRSACMNMSGRDQLELVRQQNQQSGFDLSSAEHILPTVKASLKRLLMLKSRFFCSIALLVT